MFYFKRRFLILFLLTFFVTSCKNLKEKDLVSSVKYMKSSHSIVDFDLKNYKKFFSDNWRIKRRNGKFYLFPVKKEAYISVRFFDFKEPFFVGFRVNRKDECGGDILRIYIDKTIGKTINLSKENGKTVRLKIDGDSKKIKFLFENMRKKFCTPYYLSDFRVELANFKKRVFRKKIVSRHKNVLFRGESFSLPLKKGETLKLKLKTIEGTAFLLIKEKGGRNTKKLIAFKGVKTIKIHSKSRNIYEFYLKDGNSLEIVNFKVYRPFKTYKVDYKDFTKNYNVVLVLLDAGRYDFLEKKLFGVEVTPFINALSKKSYVFKNFYSTASYTPPSIGSLLTGKYPEEHGVFSKFYRLNPQVKTIAYFLEKEKIKTFGYYGNFIFSLCKLKRDFSRTLPIKEIGKKDALESSFNDVEKALKDFYKNRAKRFFVYFHILPPHEPYNPPDEFKIFEREFNYNSKILRKKFDLSDWFLVTDETFKETVKKLYINNYIYADYLTKEIYRFLKNKGFLKDTVFIVTADHGEAFFEHKKFRHSTTLYNEMIHIPLIVKFPDKNKRVDVLSYSSNIQLFSTILKLSGVKFDENSYPPPVDFFSRNDFPIYSRAEGDEIHGSLILNGFKYIYNRGREELYDLSVDPNEMKNLFSQDDFLSLYMRRRFFEMFFENKRKENKKIRKKRKTFSSKEKRELKSLGYL